MNSYPSPDLSEEKEHFGSRTPRHYSWDRINASQQQRFIEKLNTRINLNFEYVLMNFLVAIFLIAAMLTGEFAFFLISLLIAPTVTPILGFVFGLSLPSSQLIKKSIASFIISTLVILLAGIFSGLIASQWSNVPKTSWINFLGFSWGNLGLILLGILFSFAILLRNPSQSISVANVALAYAYYLPLMAVGYLITRGGSISIRLPLVTFILQMGFALLTGIIVLLINGVGIRTRTVFVPILTGLIGLAAVVGGYFYFHPTTTIESRVFVETIATILPSPTQPAAVISENIELPTLIVSNTEVFQVPTLSQVIETPQIMATVTLTPLPTPVWAQIQAPDANGANIRSEPGYKGKIITSILNGTLVEVLPEVEVADGSTWVHIRLENQVEGWIVRSLLVSSTPAADW